MRYECSPRDSVLNTHVQPVVRREGDKFNRKVPSSTSLTSRRARYKHVRGAHGRITRAIKENANRPNSDCGIHANSVSLQSFQILTSVIENATILFVLELSGLSYSLIVRIIPSKSCHSVNIHTLDINSLGVIRIYVVRHPPRGRSFIKIVNFFFFLIKQQVNKFSIYI